MSKKTAFRFVESFFPGGSEHNTNGLAMDGSKQTPKPSDSKTRKSQREIDLEEISNTLRKRITCVEEDLERQRSSNFTLESQNKSFQEKIAQLKEKRRNEKIKIRSQEQEIGTLNTTVKDIKQRVDELEKQAHERAHELQTTTSKLKVTQAQYQQKTENYEELLLKINRLQVQLTDQEDKSARDLKEKERCLFESKMQIQQLHTENNRLGSNLSEVKMKNKELVNHSTNSEQQQATLTQTIQSLEMKVAQLKSENMSLSQEVTSLKKQNDHVNRELERHQQQNHVESSEILRLKSALAEMNARYDKKEQAYSALLKECISSRGQSFGRASGPYASTSQTSVPIVELPDSDHE